MIDYEDPSELARQVEKDLWTLLDSEFPADAVPDAFARETRRHEIFAWSHRKLFIGAEQRLGSLEVALNKGSQRILVEGESGSGKSALLANWASARRKAVPRDFVLERYLDASESGASDTYLMRRIIGTIQQICGGVDEVLDDYLHLRNSLPSWLTKASEHARLKNARWLLIFDSINRLKRAEKLAWLPAELPESMHVVVSSPAGELGNVEAWERVNVPPLSRGDSERLLADNLGTYNKTLPKSLLQRILGHGLAGNPLFISVLSEELRLFGNHEQLAECLSNYLQCGTVSDLFTQVLLRVEGDCGTENVREAMVPIWASRAGLSEREILAFAKLPPVAWAQMRNALGSPLLELNGRITISHDHLRLAVRSRFVSESAAQKLAHRKLAGWFLRDPFSRRSVEEIPWQHVQAGDPGALLDFLRNPSVIETMFSTESMTNFVWEYLNYVFVLAIREKEILEKVATVSEALVRWAMGRINNYSTIDFGFLNLMLIFRQCSAAASGDPLILDAVLRGFSAGAPLLSKLLSSYYAFEGMVSGSYAGEIIDCARELQRRRIALGWQSENWLRSICESEVRI